MPLTDTIRGKSRVLPKLGLSGYFRFANLNMRPISLNKCTRYLPFLAPGEQKGATILRIWLPCAVQTCGTQALVVPFCIWDNQDTNSILMETKVITKMFITVLVLGAIYFLHLDQILVGENFIGTAFLVFIGLSVLFGHISDKDREIQTLRYILHQSVFGSDSEKSEAHSYAVEQKLLLDIAKRDFEAKYENKSPSA